MATLPASSWRISQLAKQVCGRSETAESSGQIIHVQSSGAASAGPLGSVSLAELPRATVEEQRTLLEPLLPTVEDVKDWVTQKRGGRAVRFPFGQFDAELGYLHRDRDFVEGFDDSVCSYTYDSLGARTTIAHADKPCRINT